MNAPPHNITAAVRLIGSFVYIIEPLRAPRAALGQPKSSQELQEQPLASQEPPRGQFSKFDRKTIRIARDIPQKVKKTLRESAVRLSSTAYSSQIKLFGIRSESVRIMRIHPEVVPELRLGPSLPRAPVVRMTVVYTNSLKLYAQISFLCV